MLDVRIVEDTKGGSLNIPCSPHRCDYHLSPSPLADHVQPPGTELATSKPKALCHQPFDWLQDTSSFGGLLRRGFSKASSADGGAKCHVALGSACALNQILTAKNGPIIPDQVFEVRG